MIWLWLLSLVLSAAAVVIMISLVVVRWFNERRQQRRAAVRRSLVPVLLDEQSTEATIAQAVRRSPALASDLVIELVQMVRGDEKERLVAKAQAAGVPAQLRRRLRRGSVRDRQTAAEALADFPDDETEAALVAALDDRAAGVRIAAAMALAGIGRAPPVADLIDKLGLGTLERSRVVVDLFRRIASDRPDEIKALILAPDTPGLVRGAAVEALSTSGDYTLVPLIASLADADETSSDLTATYMRALGTLGHPAGAAVVERGLQHRDWWVRAAAAEASGHMGLTRSADRLAALLDDEQWWVQYRAGEALIELGPAGVDILRQQASGGSDRSRRAASLLLSEQRRMA